MGRRPPRGAAGGQSRDVNPRPTAATTAWSMVIQISSRNGFVAGLSRKTVIANVTINGLLPGPFDTDRLRGPVAKMEAERRGITVDQLMAERAKLNPAGRIGDPEEFGYACAFLCGAKAGFITGQNILLDGGAFPGTL